MTFKIKDGLSVGGTSFLDANRNISGNNITLTGEIRGPSTLVIDPSTVGDETGLVQIRGNLQVDGVTTTINSTTLTVDDKNIVIADGASTLSGIDTAGIDFGTSAVKLRYNYNGNSNPGLGIEGTNVGIGTTAPAYKLDVVGTAAISSDVTLSGGTVNGVPYLNGSKVLTTGSALTFDGSGVLTVGNDSVATVLNAPGDVLQFKVDSNANSGGSPNIQWLNASSELMRLNSTGLGIGTTDPGAKLHVFGGVFVNDSIGSGYLRIGNPAIANYANQYQYINFGGDTSGQDAWQIGKKNNVTDVVGPDKGFYIYDLKNSAARFVISTAGNVGIGTTNPGALLNLYKASTSADVNFLKIDMPGWSNSTGYLKNIVWGDTNVVGGIGMEYDGSTTNMHFHSFYNGGYTSTKLVTIKGNGNVGIGTTSPINNSGYGGLSLNGTSGALFSLMTNGTESSRIASLGDETSIQSKATTGYISFVQGVSGGTERARIDASGNLLIGRTSAASGFDGLQLGSTTNGKNLLLTSSSAGNNGLIQFVDTGGGNAFQINAATNQITLYGYGSRPILFYTNDTERARITSGGNVGIGTTNPDVYGFGGSLLTLQGGASYANLILAGDNNSGVAFGTSSARVGQITVDGTSGMRLFSQGTGDGLTMILNRNGNVGIGTTAPDVRFHVVNSSAETIFARFQTTGSASAFIGFAGTGATTNYHVAVGSPGPNLFAIKTDDTERLRVNATGNVGIGTTNPTKTLSVNGSFSFVGTNASFDSNDANSYPRFSGVSASAQLGLFRGSGGSEGGFYLGGDSTLFSVWSSSFSRLFNVTSSGNVGIGTTDPQGKFHAEWTSDNASAGGYFRNLSTGTSAYGGIYFGNNSSLTEGFIGVLGSNNSSYGGARSMVLGVNSAAPVVFMTGGTEKVRISSGGDVGIGTTNPNNTKLHIVGDWVSGHSTVKVQGIADDTVGYGFYNTAGSRLGYIAYTGAGFEWYNNANVPMLFYTNTAERMRISAAGNVGIGTTAPSYRLDVAGSISMHSEAQDIDSRYYGGTFLRGWQNFSAGSESNITYTTDSTSPVGTEVISVSSYVWARGPKIRLDRTQNYEVEMWVKRHVSNTAGAFYFVVSNYDSSGNVINGDGTDWHYPLSTSPPSTSWTKYTYIVGPYGGSKDHSSSAKYISVGFIANYTGGNDVIYITGFKCRPIPKYENNNLTLYNNGDVGIGTTSPAFTSGTGLEIQRSGTATLRLDSGTFATELRGYSDGTGLFQLSAGYLDLGTDSGGTTRLRITSNGNVGIGTTAPTKRLDVKGTTTGSVIRASVTDGAGSSSFGYGFYIDNTQHEFAQILGNYVSSGGSGYGGLKFNVANNGLYTALTIDYTGKVGIGTTNPSTKLHLYESDAADAIFRITPANGSYDALIQMVGQGNDIATEGFEIWYNNSIGDVHLSTTYANDAAAIRFHTRTGASKSTSNERLTILGDGQIHLFGKTKIGSGTNNNGNILNIVNGPYNQVNITHGASTGWGLLLGYGDGSIVGDYHGANHAAIINVQNAPLHLGTNNNSRLTILGDGNVGIGTTAPAARIDAYQELSGSGWTRIISRDANKAAFIGVYRATNAYSPGIFAHNSALNAWADLWINGHDDGSGGLGGGTANKVLIAGNVLVGTTNTDVGGSVAGIRLGPTGKAFFSTDNASGLGNDEPLYIDRRDTSGDGIAIVLARHGYYKAGIGVLRGGSAAAAGSIYFATALASNVGFAERMRITSGGNVGIGETNPSLPLHIASSQGYPNSSGTTEVGFLTLRNKSAGSTHGLWMGVANVSPYGSWLQAADANNFATNYPLLLNPNGGNVGIGIVDPLANLHIVNNNTAYDGVSTNSGSGFRMQNSNAGQVLLRADHSTGALYDGDLAILTQFYDGSSYVWKERARFVSSGNVGIGTTAPGAGLEFGDNTTQNKYDIKIGNQTTARAMTFAPYATIGTQYSAWNLGLGCNIRPNIGSTSSGYEVATSFVGQGGSLVEVGFDTLAYYQWTASDLTGLSEGSTLSTTNKARFFINSSGNFGIGTTSPAASLHIAVASNAVDGSKGVRITNPAGTVAVFECGVNNDSFVGTTSTSNFNIRTDNTARVTFDTSGRVGIGTTAPSFKLDVSGTVRFTGSNANRPVTIDTNVNIQGETGGWAVQHGFKGSSGTDRGGFGALGNSDSISYYWIGSAYDSNQFVLTSGSNVGIGTNSPNRKLHVQSSGAAIQLYNANDNSGTGLFFAGSSTNKNWFIGNQYNVNDGLEFTPSAATGTTTPGSSPSMVIKGNGDVGIGTTAPSTKLDVNGDVTATSFNATSDRNRKENIQTIENALDMVNNLRGVRFTWKDSKEKSLGVIAQEVEEIIPEVVQTSTTNGEKTVAYGNIVGVLIEAIKEQQSEINELKSLVKQLIENSKP